MRASQNDANRPSVRCGRGSLRPGDPCIMSSPMDEETHVEPARDRARRASEQGELRPTVAGYDIIRLVGRGGMGVVWEATEYRLERRVALKVHAGGATPERVAALWAEAQLAAKIAHPGVVPVYEVGETLDQRPY